MDVQRDLCKSTSIEGVEAKLTVQRFVYIKSNLFES